MYLHVKPPPKFNPVWKNKWIQSDWEQEKLRALKEKE
jgi:hypothetical protein